MGYSDNKMYKKLAIGTDIGKLKILPVNAVSSTRVAMLDLEWNILADRIQYPPSLLGRLGEDLQLLLQQGPETPHWTKGSVRESLNRRKENDIRWTCV